MIRWTIRIFIGLSVLVVVVVGIAWSVMAIPFFSEFRRSLVSELLSDQIGQPLLVNGDVNVVVAPVTRVKAQGVQIPSENMTNVDLAKLENLEFDVDLIALLDRRVDVNNLFVDGLSVNLLRTESGATSFNETEKDAIGSKKQSTTTVSEGASTQNQNQNQKRAGGQGSLLAFLKSRKVSFTDIGLIIDDDASGFEYEFLLNEFALEQVDNGSTLRVSSDGTVNGQPFILAGNYPTAAPFSTQAEFGSAVLSFDGEPLASEDGGGFVGNLDFEIGSIGDFLDILKLKRSLDGSGSVSARVENRTGTTGLFDLKSELELSKGQKISLSGNIENIVDFNGVDLKVDTRLHAENNPPSRATEVSELKLTNASTRIVSQVSGVELEGLVFSTNAFDHGLEKVGPVSIAHIGRTPEGTLAFEGISLQAGPLDQPILKASGNILNLLELSDLDFTGTLNTPASFFLLGLEDASADMFGGVEAEFKFDDAEGTLRVSRFAGRSVNTDVWSLAADIEIGDVKTLDGLQADFDLGIADGASFLAALGLQPINTGAFGLGISVTGEDRRWKGGFELAAGSSTIESSVSAEAEGGRQTLRASVSSERLAVADVVAARDGLIELAKIGKQSKGTTDADTKSEQEENKRVELQPLVLTETTGQIATAAQTENSEANDVTGADAEMQRIIEFNDFLARTDIFADVEFREIVGIKGVTSLSSELVSEGGKARLGPVEFTYGTGYFNFVADADVLEAPKYVSMSGSTSGWTLSEILSLAGVDFEADGNLSGRFDVSGNLSSIETFLNSMAGSASVEMLDGQVATSLLELAGLGIFPWLFSEEFQQGYTDVVCVNAPIAIRGGAFSFDEVVAETESVQLVAKGRIDLKGDAISIRAEPRPVGKPLSRSAWPFDVSGKLSDPRFKLDIGGSRSKRADGAKEMPADRKPCQPDILQLQ